jgi:hypothetical protein
VYSAVASGGLVVAGLTGGSVAVSGFFASKFVFLLPASAGMQTIAMSAFSGTETAAFPFSFLDDLAIEADVTNEVKLTAKVGSQDKVPLGNRATAPMTTSRLPSLAQPTDYPMAGWQQLIYIDPLSNSPFTTLFSDLEVFKLSFSTGLKPTYLANNRQVYDRLYQDASSTEVKLETTLDFRDIVEYEKYRTNQKRIVGIKLLDYETYLGNSSGPVHRYWQFTLPMKWLASDPDRGKEKVEAKFQGICEYEDSLGYAARLEVVCQQPPNYQTL